MTTPISRSFSNTVASARGDVSLYLVDGSGLRIPFVSRHNTLSYAASGAVAAAYGGDTSLVPKHIGFVYGSSQEPPGLADPTSRNMSWDKISSEMGMITGNVLISDFITTPELSTSQGTAPSGTYSGNAVTFRGCTSSGSAGTYGFPTNPSSGYAGEFGDGKYLYHALLLGDVPCQRCSDLKEYTVLARVSLKKGTFRQKPENYELALDWTVTFF